MIAAKFSDKQLIVDILTKSFDTNKSVNYVIKQDNKRIQRIKALMEYSFEICWHFGEVYFTDDRTGAALFLLSSKKKTLIKSVSEDFKLIVRSIGIKKILSTAKRESYINKIRPKGIDYLYFWYFGILPEFQGSGTAKRFKDEIFEMSKKRNLPIYLETSGEKQKNSYQRYGFEIYHVWQSEFNLYFMRRNVN